MITKDLRARPLSRPVFYPGSIERTSFAEKDEKKGYLMLDVETEEAIKILSAPSLRSLAPQTMNISAAFPK